MTKRQTVSLFPLKSVLFPGTLLQLKVFEARYLDLASQCLREKTPFGVVCLAAGNEAGRGNVRFESHGVLAHIDTVDAEGANLLKLRCLGVERFTIVGKPAQQDNGLWSSEIELLMPDDMVSPEPELFGTVRALQQVIASLIEKGNSPFAEPYRSRRRRLGGQPLVRDPADSAGGKAKADDAARSAGAAAAGA